MAAARVPKKSSALGRGMTPEVRMGRLLRVHAERFRGRAVRVMHGNVCRDVHEYAQRVCAVCACCVRACASFGPLLFRAEKFRNPGLSWVATITSVHFAHSAAKSR
jgi:hypothetical protein